MGDETTGKESWGSSVLEPLGSASATVEVGKIDSLQPRSSLGRLMLSSCVCLKDAIVG